MFTQCTPHAQAEEFSRQALRDKLRADDSCLVAFKTRCKVGGNAVWVIDTLHIHIPIHTSPYTHPPTHIPIHTLSPRLVLMR